MIPRCKFCGEEILPSNDETGWVDADGFEGCPDRDDQLHEPEGNSAEMRAEWAAKFKSAD